MSKTQFRPKVEIEPYNSKLTIFFRFPDPCWRMFNLLVFDGIHDVMYEQDAQDLWQKIKPTALNIQ